jgi:glycosyltransferase involved in cell wall biosynthesis
MESVKSVRAIVPYDSRDPAVRERVLAWKAIIGADADYYVERGRIAHIRPSRRPADSDLVFRNAVAWSQGQVEAGILRSSKFGIYELDDALFLDDGRLPGLERWWKPLVAKDRIAQHCLASCARVIAGNDRIAEWASAKCRDVRVIPTCVEVSEYTMHRVDAERSLVDGSRNPDLVWIGGAATEQYLFEIAESLCVVHRKTGAQLTMIGGHRPRLPHVMRGFTTVVPWYPGVHRNLGSYGGVGVMPLPDHPYEHHKCAYKLLQYAASAMVTVGSPYGASAEALRRFRGFAVSSPTGWADALVASIEMPESLRQDIGEQARREAESHYSFARWEPEYRAAIGVAP